MASFEEANRERSDVANCDDDARGIEAIGRAQESGLIVGKPSRALCRLRGYFMRGRCWHGITVRAPKHMKDRVRVTLFGAHGKVARSYRPVASIAPSDMGQVSIGAGLLADCERASIALTDQDGVIVSDVINGFSADDRRWHDLTFNCAADPQPDPLLGDDEDRLPELIDGLVGLRHAIENAVDHLAAIRVHR